MFKIIPPRLTFARIPGPGEYDGFDIVDSFPIVTADCFALTYDGENWWVDYSGEIYCFDQNGDYVRSFPQPDPGDYVTGLGWDGDYLWIANRMPLYQKDIYGNPGPYGMIDIYGYGTYCLTIKDDRIIIGNYMISWEDATYLWVYDFNGNDLFVGFTYPHGFGDWEEFGALAYHDGIVWTSYSYGHEDHQVFIYELLGLEYSEGGHWPIRTMIDIEGEYIITLAVCDADFINIAEASLGQIKAYFADKEK